MSRRDTETVEARIGAHVKARRLQLGLTQADVAEAMQRLGHSWIQTTVAKTEAADRPLRVNELADLAQVLGERLRHLVSSSNDWTLEAVQVELEQSMMHANRLRSDVEELEHQLKVKRTALEETLKRVKDLNAEFHRVDGQR